MKIIIGENTESKLSGLLQTKIGEILDDIKKRYRKEEIGASNWYLNTFSRIDKVVVRNLKVNPHFSIYIDVYSNDGYFDEDDVQGFAKYLKEELSFIGNPWVVPMLINNNLEDEDMISENEKPKLKDSIQSMVDGAGLYTTIKSLGGYDTFNIIAPGYFEDKDNKIKLIKDIVVSESDDGDNIIYFYDLDGSDIFIHSEEVDDGNTHEDYITCVGVDSVHVSVHEYDYEGFMYDEGIDEYNINLVNLKEEFLNQVFDKLVNEFLR
jgi:hypothetical protein